MSSMTDCIRPIYMTAGSIETVNFRRDLHLADVEGFCSTGGLLESARKRDHVLVYHVLL